MSPVFSVLIVGGLIAQPPSGNHNAGPPPSGTVQVDPGSSAAAIEILNAAANDPASSPEVATAAAFAATIAQSAAAAGKLRCFVDPTIGFASTYPDASTPSGPIYTSAPGNYMQFPVWMKAKPHVFAATLVHECVHAVQEEDDPEDPKENSKMDYVAYCLEHEFWLWARAGVPNQSMQTMREILLIGIDTGKNKQLELEEVSC